MNVGVWFGLVWFGSRGWAPATGCKCRDTYNVLGTVVVVVPDGRAPAPFANAHAINVLGAPEGAIAIVQEHTGWVGRVVTGSMSLQAV